MCVCVCVCVCVYRAHLSRALNSLRFSVFDRGEPAPVNDNDYGTIRLRFEDCATGLVEYDLTEPGVSGSIAIQRVVQDNVALCESLSGSVD